MYLPSLCSKHSIHFYVGHPVSKHCFWLELEVASSVFCITLGLVVRLCKAGPRGRARRWATLGVHPLSWLLSNNWLEKAHFVSMLRTSSNQLLLSNQDKGCTPSVVHPLALPLGPALHNVSNVFSKSVICIAQFYWHIFPNKRRYRPFAHIP